MKRYNKTFQTFRTFNIDWLVGTVCNYNCSYCHPDLHDGKYPFVDIDKAKLFLNRLVNKYEDTEFVLMISGGEPTIWPHLPEFMKEAKRNDIQVQLITNGSRSIKWWVKNAPFIDLTVISFHWEFASPDHIEEMCKTLREKYKSHMKVNILTTLERFEDSYEFAERLQKNVPGIITELRAIRKNHGIYLIDYSKEQLERLKEKNRFGGFKETFKSPFVYTDQKELITPNDLIFHKENSWKGWKCNIGLESMKVSYDGTITRGNCDVGGIIGNINDEYILPAEPVICTNDFCKCPTDIRATKERI